MPGASASLPPPPRAPRIPVLRELHGTADVDGYAWMRDLQLPAMRDYLAAERAYYDAHSRPLSELAGELFRAAAGRTASQAEDSVRWPRHGYAYWTRMPEDAENLQFLRAKAGEITEQLLLDENIVADATGFADIGIREPSPDGKLLAWSADISGAEIYELRITDLATGKVLPDLVPRTCPGSAWSADSRYLFYLVPDHLHRPCQVWRHRIGTDASADVLVMTEDDARFEVELRTSRSGEVAIITSASRDTTEVRLIPMGDPEHEPVVVAPRRRGIEYRADHASGQGDGADGGEFYLVTDDGATEYRLMRVPMAAPGAESRAGMPGREDWTGGLGRENWAEVPCLAVYPARTDTRLVSCDVLAGHLLLTLRRDGAPLLAITDRAGGNVREVPAATPAATIRVARAEDYDARSVLIAEESLIEPPAWSELDLATGERTELKRQQVPGYDPAGYRTQRLHAIAADGTRIPVTLAYRAGTLLDGSAPCLLYGYGAYESCEDPVFDISLPSILDRGVVYAIAHVRGGGECGRGWWQQGRLGAKPNTFDDFVAVAGWLAGDAPGSPALIDGGRIVSRGLSAGGLLQAAVYSRAPGRWRAVVAEVPFVDCVNTMLDAGIPLTVNEWDEWGDPRDPDDFACLRAYSPYENPPPGPRPDLLVTGTVNDPRVLIHEPAKWVALLRETDTAGSRVLFRAELGAGAHTGPSGRFARLAYEAEVQAFILDAMGLPA
jgi:oligopeptidase B